MEAGGGQILQQIEQLLAQLAQEQPDPQVQHAIKGIQQQVEPLQQIVGGQQGQNMQGGLNNPGAPGEQAPPPGGMPGMNAGGGAGAEEAPPAGGPGGGAPHGGATPVLAIHVAPGGPKSFGEAKKAAMATHAERGHFDKNTPKGETPSTPRTKAKAKG